MTQTLAGCFPYPIDRRLAIIHMNLNACLALCQPALSVILVVAGLGKLLAMLSAERWPLGDDPASPFSGAIGKVMGGAYSAAQLLIGLIVLLSPGATRVWLLAAAAVFAAAAGWSSIGGRSSAHSDGGCGCLGSRQAASSGSRRGVSSVTVAVAMGACSLLSGVFYAPWRENGRVGYVLSIGLFAVLWTAWPELRRALSPRAMLQRSHVAVVTKAEAWTAFERSQDFTELDRSWSMGRALDHRVACDQHVFVTAASSDDTVAELVIAVDRAGRVAWSLLDFVDGQVLDDSQGLLGHLATCRDDGQ